MNYKKLIVSADNKLVLEDYNLNTSNSEILDLNKSLSDVATDEELQIFIKENAIDSKKVYFICLKEDFGTNDQRIENIPNVKKSYKAIKKIFKKFPNIFFFIYNTFMKNDAAINPSIDTPSSINAQEVDVIQENISADFEKMQLDEQNENAISEQSLSNGEISHDETIIDENLEKDDISLEKATEIVEPFVESVGEPIGEVIEEKIEHVDKVLHDGTEISGTIEEKVVSVENAENIDEPIHKVEEHLVINEITHDENATEEKIDQVKIIEEKTIIDGEVTTTSHEEIIKDNSNDEILFGENDILTSDEIINDGPSDDNIIVDDEIEINIHPSSSSAEDKWTELENTNEVFKDTILESNQLSSPYDPDVERFNDMNLSTSANNDVQNNEIEIPESYFNEEEEEQISYEDYHEFQNDYELNVHALKSIYDFIWRMLVLNNYNLKLNDLLYLSVNNLAAFSIGQSDFVRQTANKAESLFDLILQLDIKLEFNNSLFYIYLAELFSIQANKIVVNNDFLNTISIWINKSSKDKFVSQVEQFINYSTIYNKKIIFAYFIELSNFIKGCIPTITPALNLLDIHRIMNNPLKTVRQSNIFGFMVRKMNEIFMQNGISIESEIVETPENMFTDSKDNYLSDSDINWKTKLARLYKRLLENVRNYVLSKGNSEGEIFNIYIDIKDLRMYKSDFFENSSAMVDSINNGGNYLTIGDALNRANTIVPSQVENIPPFMINPNEPISTTPSYYGQNTINNSFEPKTYASPIQHDSYVDPSTLNQPSRPITRFNSSELEDSMTRRIEEYERKIKENIARIETERKNLREKMEMLKNL